MEANKSMLCSEISNSIRIILSKFKDLDDRVSFRIGGITGDLPYSLCRIKEAKEELNYLEELLEEFKKIENEPWRGK